MQLNEDNEYDLLLQRLLVFLFSLYDLKNKWDPWKIKEADWDVDNKTEEDDDDGDENENGVLVKLSTCAWEDPS